MCWHCGTRAMDISDVILSHSSCKQCLRCAIIRGVWHLSLTTFSSGNRTGSSSATPFLVCVILHCFVKKKHSYLRGVFFKATSVAVKSLLTSLHECRYRRSLNELCQEHWYNPKPSESLAFGLVAGHSLAGYFCLCFRPHSVHFLKRKKEKDLEYWLVWPQYVPTVWWFVPDASEPRKVSAASGLFFFFLS